MPAIPVVIKEERIVVKEQKAKPKPKKPKTVKAPELPSVCSMCGKEYPNQQGYFPQVQSIAYAHNYNYTTVCNDCIEQFYNDHVKKYDNDKDKAVRRTCEWLDAYYDPKVVEKLGREFKFADYIRRIRMSSTSINKTWDDTIADEEDKRLTGVISTSSELSQSELLEAVDIFGEGFEEKAYEYMMRIYRGYVSPLGDTATAGQLKSARFLAALEYRCMEAIKNDKPNASALSSTLRKSIAESGFDTVVKKDDDNDMPLGVLLKQIETYTPAQYVKNSPYKDVDKQGTYYDRFCRRPLMNLLNRASQKVEDELSITDEEAAAFDSIGSDDDG